MNTCIKNSKFPSEMKYAKLSPLFKKTDNLLKENYRPVSILTAISKIHEDLMNDQLYAYFEDIFEELLSAFRKKYSCQSLLTKLIDDWKISLDSNQVVGAVLWTSPRLSTVYPILSSSLSYTSMVLVLMHVNFCLVIEVAGTKEWRFMTEVTGSSFQKVYHKDPFLDLYYSISSWMTCFFLSSIAIHIVMLMTIPCLHG